jgi:uncharacterized membrane protein YjjP (DUF1212 family)
VDVIPRSERAVDRPTDTPLPVSEGTRRRTAEELSDYLAEIGGMLTRYGCPAYRIEGLVRVVADLEGHDAESFALPTGIFLTVTPRGARMAPVHRMVRLHEWSVNLDKLLFVDAVFNDVANDRCPIEEARVRLAAIDARPPVYRPLTFWLAVAATSAAAAVFFRGHGRDVAFAALLGLVVHALGRILRKHAQARFLGDFIGAAVCAAVAAAAGWWFPDASREVIVLGGMIALFPGMTFTTGLAEVAQKNLVAGAARLMEAMVTFLALIFGIALSSTLARALGVVDVALPARSALPWPWQVAALVAISFGFGIAFQIPKRLLWAALVSGGTSYAVMSLLQSLLPGHVAAFLAATVVCAVANLLARATDRPAQLFHLPGMMLLVPGSLGFAGFQGFLHGDWALGAAKLASTVLVAAGLVMGVLMANVLVSPKKLL